MSSTVRSLSFSPLEHVSWLSHGFAIRQEELDVRTAKPDLRSKLQQRHDILLRAEGVHPPDLQLVSQVHGNKVLVLDEAAKKRKKRTMSEADGMVTATPGVAIGVHVADCCAVYLVEMRHRVIGLLHSGRKGTEANIVKEGVKALRSLCAGHSTNIIAALSPCIHSCCYEVDFVGEIESQLHSQGITEIWRHPDCTGCHTDLYYSYRKEKGQTGRMLAFLMIRDVDHE